MTEQVPLRDYVDVQFASLKEIVNAHAKANNEAVTAARNSMDKRLDAMNEFRQSLNDMAKVGATRDQLDSIRQSADNRFGAVIDKVNDVKVQVAVVAALVSLIMSIIVVAISRFIK